MRTLAMVVIGDELLDGRISDVNTAELGRLCRDRGGTLRLTLTVPDRADAVAEAVDLAARALPQDGLVITSGGLGPTLDDATRAGLAHAVGEALVEDPDAVERVRAKYARFGRTLEAAGRRQALRPEGASFLESQVGTADGLRMRVQGRELLALPGVPREFRHLLGQYVTPLLDAGERLHFRRGWLFGIGESEVATRLEEAARDFPTIGISYCARYPVIELELRHGDVDAVDIAWAATTALLEPWLLPPPHASPEAALGARLAEEGLWVTCAESCTGGLLASRLTDLPGASAWLERTWVTYADAAKTDELGVPAELLTAHGAVSEEVAVAMARGALERSGADLAVAISGIAGPTGGTPAKPVGRVHIAVADARSVSALVADFPRMERRTFKRQATATAALLALRKVDGREGGLKAMYGVRSVR